MRVALLCLTTYASSCMAWSSYKSKIPNGNMGGVGHSSCTSPSSCSGPVSFVSFFGTALLGLAMGVLSGSKVPLKKRCTRC